MPQASAIIIADSISPEGIRLTTFQLRYWRAIHAELMTHRVFSRNAGSSRARPSATIIDSVSREPWGPIHWGKNQPGMQAHIEHNALVEIPEHLCYSYAVFFNEIFQLPAHLDHFKSGGTMPKMYASNKQAWHFYAWLSGQMSGAFDTAGYHKQIVNRMTEAVNNIDVVVTATDFANWFALRDHADAQPEIRELAQLMREVYDHSTPEQLAPGDWHLPYIEQADYDAAETYLYGENYHANQVNHTQVIELLKKASAARCARVSYKLHDGSKTDFAKDLELFERLLVSQPLHASPAEHQATPDQCMGLHANNIWRYRGQHGNFRGWRQFRKMLPNEFVAG